MQSRGGTDNLGSRLAGEQPCDERNGCHRSGQHECRAESDSSSNEPDDQWTGDRTEIRRHAVGRQRRTTLPSGAENVGERGLMGRREQA